MTLIAGMIAAGLIAQEAHTRFVFVDDPGPQRVVVQVIVMAPEDMSDREQAAWALLPHVLADGTQEFSRDRLAQFAGQAGVPLVIESFSDFLSVRIVEPKEGLKVAMQIAESIFYRASLTDTARAIALDAIKRMKKSVWSEALDVLSLPYHSVDKAVLESVYRTAFQPSNAVIVVGGAASEADARREIEYRFKTGTKPPKRTRFDRQARPLVGHIEPVTTHEMSLQGKLDAEGLVAVASLGVGKGGAMHRVLRDAKGWSYRQEAVLWPTRKGLEGRLIFATTNSDLGLGGEARSELIKDVESWTPATLIRAKAVLKSSISGTNQLNPIYLGPSQLMDGSLESICAWRGLQALSIDSVSLSDIEAVNDLGRVKARAKSLLDQANLSVMPGQK